MAVNPSGFKGDTLPVERISWEDCQRFCKESRLSLPTEAQWEYACRAGKAGPYAGTGELDDMGWYGVNSGRRTHSVGEKKPNAFGLYDMHGNVWEWCEDWYEEDFYRESAGLVDPLCENSGSGNRVPRGAGWLNSAGPCRSAYRTEVPPSARTSDNVGFRAAWSSP